MLVKIDQQLKLSSVPEASEKFYIFKGEDSYAMFMGLDGRFHPRMMSGYGRYFDTYNDAKKFAEAFLHTIEESTYIEDI